MRSTCVAQLRATFCCVTLYGQSHAVSMWQWPMPQIFAVCAPCLYTSAPCAAHALPSTSSATLRAAEMVALSPERNAFMIAFAVESAWFWSGVLPGIVSTISR
jgi:hypothetical protein